MSRRRKYRSFIYIFILFYATFQCPCHRDNERKEKKKNVTLWFGSLVVGRKLQKTEFFLRA